MRCFATSSLRKSLKQRLSQHAYFEISFIFCVVKLALETPSFLSTLSLSLLLGCFSLSLSWNPSGESLTSVPPSVRGKFATSPGLRKRLSSVSSSGSLPNISDTTREIAQDSETSPSSSLPSEESLSDITIVLRGIRYCIWTPLIFGKSTRRRIGNLETGDPGGVEPLGLGGSPSFLFPASLGEQTNKRWTHLLSPGRIVPDSRDMSNGEVGNARSETGIAPDITIFSGVPCNRVRDLVVTFKAASERLNRVAETRIVFFVPCPYPGIDNPNWRVGPSIDNLDIFGEGTFKCLRLSG